MTIIELKLDLLNILKAQPDMKVEWKPRKHVYQIRWKNEKKYTSGNEAFIHAKQLHKMITKNTYDFSFLEHNIFDKHFEIFI